MLVDIPQPVEDEADIVVRLSLLRSANGVLPRSSADRLSRSANAKGGIRPRAVDERTLRGFRVIRPMALADISGYWHDQHHHPVRGGDGSDGLRGRFREQALIIAARG
jgi:hypothetical protein